MQELMYLGHKYMMETEMPEGRGNVTYLRWYKVVAGGYNNKSYSDLVGGLRPKDVEAVSSSALHTICRGLSLHQSKRLRDSLRSSSLDWMQPTPIARRGHIS